jgi:hypothetical protein
VFSLWRIGSSQSRAFQRAILRNCSRQSDKLPALRPTWVDGVGEAMYLALYFSLPIGSRPGSRESSAHLVAVLAIGVCQRYKFVTTYLHVRVRSVKGPKHVALRDLPTPQHSPTLSGGRRGEGEEAERGEEDAGGQAAAHRSGLLVPG